MNADYLLSRIKRQNILNNKIALSEIKKEMNFGGISWGNELIFTIDAVTKIFDVDYRTIQRLIMLNQEELTENGFRILTGDALLQLRKNGVISSRGGALSVFSFRAVLNIAMLLTASEKAKEIRNRILDITLNVVNQKARGNMTYINQRDPDFLEASYQNENGRKQFTHMLNQAVDMGPYKYEYFTNKIYQCIFLEKAKEYQRILKLRNRTNLRDTMYTEVLQCITSIEGGAAYELEKAYNEKNALLTKEEAAQIIENLSQHPALQPFINQARNKMASRDLSFRDAEHEKLEQYITAVDPEDFERFLGEKSKSLEQQIKEHREIFLRLKDK